MSKSRNSSIVMPVDADVVLLPTRGAPPDSGSFASIRCGAGGDESLNFTDGNDECIEVITSDSGTNTGGSASRRDSITEAVVKVEAAPIARKSPKSHDGILCQVCRDLDLKVEDFVISYTRHRQAVRGPGPSFYGERSMGTLQAIKRRHPCPLCALLVDSLGSPCQGEPECHITWVNDGMELPNDKNEHRTIHRTRRLQIIWRKSTSMDDYSEPEYKPYIVMIAPDASLDAPNTIKDGCTKCPSLFLGRRLKSLTDLYQDSFDLAKKWLGVCLQNHGTQCCAPEPLRRRGAYELQRSPSFAVVDLNEMRLTALPNDKEMPQYVAMSYMWGMYGPDDERVECKEDNIRTLRLKHGIKALLRRLPRPIQDGINLTLKFGIRYFWVSALCIVQDNDWSWTNNASMMDVIYSNATLTICAADNDSAKVGLKALWPCQISKYDPEPKQTYINYRTSADRESIDLLLSHPPEFYMAKSRWNSRGWILQERLLSPRCLLFVDGRMYFQCRCTTMSEDIHCENAIAGWSVELHKAPAQTLNNLKRDPLTAYKELVRMYTSRGLNFETDVLDAFKGISHLIKEYLGTGCEMLYGLPSSHLDWALLWRSDQRMERRVGVKADYRMTSEFPSWAWCGWKGGQVAYRSSTVFGAKATADLHQWLQNHTWITYYITNGHGRLRLVWDPKLHSPNRDIDGWTGYESPEKFIPPTKDSIMDTLHRSYDLHGRDFSRSIPALGRVSGTECGFKRHLSPSQLQVVVLESGHDCKADFAQSQKPQFDEIYLQFFTWSAKFQIREVDESLFSCGGKPGVGMKRFVIVDKHGSLSGTCVLDEKWGDAARNGIPQEFIALSSSREFDGMECSVQTFYNGAQAESEWQVYNVMMLEYRQGDDYEIAYRAGIGKVYRLAFSHSLQHPDEWTTERDGMYWKEIVLG